MLKPLYINTLGVLRDEGYSVTGYCGERGCLHSAKLDLDALIDRLGDGFVGVGDPNPLVPKLRCAGCGGRNIELRVSPPTGYEYQA